MINEKPDRKGKNYPI